MTEDRGYRIGEASRLGVNPEKIIEFLRAEWKKPIALYHSRFYEWQFKGSPAGNGEDRCLVIADREGGVHGFMGLNSKTFYLGGKPVPGAELTTWVISEKLRGHGFGLYMLRHLEKRYEVLMGMGITPAALPVYLEAGFRYVRHVPRYVKILNFDRVRAVSELTLNSERLAKKALKSPQACYNWREIGPEEAGACADKLYRDHNSFSRSADDLRWRYSSHPAFDYRIYRVDSCGGTAVVVIREDERKELKYAHLADAYGDHDAIPGAAAFVEQLGRDHGLDMVDFYCTAPDIARFFWCSGWFSMVDDYYVQVPHLFYPIDMRKPPTTSVGFWSRDHMSDMADMSRLYVTKGDCDLDRPTGMFLEEKGWK